MIVIIFDMRSKWIAMLLYGRYFPKYFFQSVICVLSKELIAIQKLQVWQFLRKDALFILIT